MKLLFKVAPKRLGGLQVGAIQALLNLLFKPVAFKNRRLFLFLPAPQAVADYFAWVLVVATLNLVRDKFFQPPNERYLHEPKLAGVHRKVKRAALALLLIKSAQKPRSRAS